MIRFYHFPCLYGLPRVRINPHVRVTAVTDKIVTENVEALKFLSGTGTNLKGRLLVWDGLTMDFSTYALRKDPACPACSTL